MFGLLVINLVNAEINMSQLQYLQYLLQEQVVKFMFFCFCFCLVALNDALKEEIQHLKLLTGQNIANGGPMMNFPSSYGTNQQFYSNNQAMHMMLTAQQFQQLQIHSQKQQHQFQQQQLHQFQQQQQLHHQQQQPQMQQQEQHLSQSGDLKMKGSLSSTSVGESSSDINMHAAKD